MLLIVLMALLTISFFIMMVMIFTASRQLAEATRPAQSASEILGPAVSTTAYGLIATVRHIIKYVSIHLLVALHNLVLFGRAILSRIERRFSLLIDAVRGRGETRGDRHRGSVSFFLEQIKDYKEEMIRRADNR